MADAPNKPPRVKLEELLLRHGAIDEQQLAHARAEQKKWGGAIGRVLVDLGFIGEDLLMRASAHQLGIPFVDASFEIPPDITNAIPVQVCERFGVVPVGGDLKAKMVRFATFDPGNTEHLRQLTAATGYRIEAAAATSASIEVLVRRSYYGEAVSEPAPTGRPPPRAAAAPKPELPLDLSAPPAPIAPANVPPAMKPAPASSADLASLVSRVQKLEQQLLSNPLFAALTARLERLEQLAEVQIHVLRTISDILVEQKLISREDYLKRARR